MTKSKETTLDEFIDTCSQFINLCVEGHTNSKDLNHEWLFVANSYMHFRCVENCQDRECRQKVDDAYKFAYEALCDTCKYFEQLDQLRITV